MEVVIPSPWCVLAACVAAGAFAASCSDEAPGGAAPASDEGGALPDVAPMPPGAGCSDAGASGSPTEATQRYGTACLCCHGDEFGVAGSVSPIGSVARVVVTGSDGDVADMVPNQFGNFFRHFPLATPVSAVVYTTDGRAATMRELAPSANCNACHSAVGPVPPIAPP